MTIPIPSQDRVTPDKAESRIISSLAKRIKQKIDLVERSDDFVTLLAISDC